MITNLIGYLIGGIFVCLVMSPIFIGIWLAYDRIELLANSKKTQAVITSCYHRSQTGSSKTKYSWVPVATTREAITIRGDFGWKKKSWCESDIGDNVTVYVYSNESDKNRINTFFQLWFYPCLAWLVSVLMIYAGYKKHRQRKRQNTRKLGAP